MRVLSMPWSLYLTVGRSAALALAALMLGSAGAEAAAAPAAAGEAGEFEFGFKDTYMKYGLAETMGGTPEFGGHPTRRGDCPSVRAG
ncbi:hypothetical protein BH23CHL8_BH23CHL8_04670 [soil metagenome]